MQNTFRLMLAALAFASAVPAGIAAAYATPITPEGQRLAQELDSMGVETKWIAGAHVSWRSGLPDGLPELNEGSHTHCSAFVAAAAEKLGVYILRPPRHGAYLLANAQNEWLASEGSEEGWRPVASMEKAQDAANHGELVVASYHNHHDDKPGHIAIVRPSEKSASEIASEGPEVIQAATVNSAKISVRAGFAGHPHAWADQEIVYYVHAISWTAAASEE